MDRFISEELERLETAGTLRTLVEVKGQDGAYATIGAKRVLVMCSNDYLGLANNAEVKEAAVRAVKEYGAGAGASRLVSGNMTPHVLLEEKIREFKGTEAALLFNSGYNANLGCITALADRSTEIFSDRLNHASIVDACVLSRARVRRYPSRDVDTLERLLKKSTAARKLVVTDGVFSMDGTIAPLGDIIQLLDRFGATLFVDDAHAAGILGSGGRGTLEHFGITHPSVIQMGTLGKAFGSFGAYVAGSDELKRLLVSKARPFIYTTALPPAVCAASAKAIEVAEARPGLRARVIKNARLMRELLNAAGLDTLGSGTQIIPVLTGSPQETIGAARKIFDSGIFIQGIRPPTVPEGTSRLRVTVSALHTEEDIRNAAAAITGALGLR